jgi:hypothetical protein
MSGVRTFQADPTKIASVHRQVNERIVVPSVWWRRNGLQGRCQSLRLRDGSHVRRLRDETIHTRS